jgi:uncharacterized protein (DUF488 family)
LLTEHGVQVLVDVRRFPASRRHPQFSHEPDLGGRRAARPGSQHTAWRVEAFRGYADHMESPEFAAALERLMRRAAAAPTAILCAEAVPWRCHRRLISDALVARGFEVVHILSPGHAEPHALDPNARVLPGGRLLYAGPAEEQASLFEGA